MNGHDRGHPLNRNHSVKLEALSAFDHTLLAQLAEGFSNMQIATHVGRSEKTIRNRLSEIHQKLGVPNRAAAVAVWLGHASTLQVTTAEFPQ